MKCVKCGAEAKDGQKFCVYCGSALELSQEEVKEGLGNVVEGAEEKTEERVENTADSSEEKGIEGQSAVIKNGKKRKVKIIAAIVALCIISGGGFFAYSEIQVKNYNEKATSAAYMMADIGGSSNELCNSTIDVWNNAICKRVDATTDQYTRPGGYYFVRDFNDALDNFFADQYTQNKIWYIQEGQNQISETMKGLMNPPKRCEEFYSEIKDLYEAIMRLADLATYPKGSLESYSEECRSASRNFSSCYDKTKLHFTGEELYDEY